ncbi:hypothetical protein AB3N04_00105 (plasmid) [Alkalihalophilus sp. As8PL]|uniref:Uncharacterized protein n=1 Tax=Alkalihalophilus sp. As8PL TaxID=3237103 RepID=A0AB39BNQ2_9BACI
MIVGHHSSRLTFSNIASISGYPSYTSSQHRLLSDGTWRVTLDYSNVPRNGWVANEVRFTARNSGFTWNASQHGGSWYQSGAGRPYSDWQFMPTGAAHMLNSVRVGN